MDPSFQSYWYLYQHILNSYKWNTGFKNYPKGMEMFWLFSLKNAALWNTILKKKTRLWLKKWCMLVMSQKGFTEPITAQPSQGNVVFSIHHFTLCRVWKCFKNTGSSLFMPLYQYHISSLIPELMTITSTAVLFWLKWHIQVLFL